MEAIEFYLWEGSIRYRIDGEEKILSQNDREVVEFVLDNLRRFFPEALMALSDLFSDSAVNKRYFDFRRVDRFIRCNFSEHDRLSYDINSGVLYFEEVRCPLRVICKHERVICKPKFKALLPEEEKKVAALYSRGFTVDEIAGILKKKAKTVKNQLSSITKRLNLNRTKDLIKIFSIYNGFTLWE